MLCAHNLNEAIAIVAQRIIGVGGATLAISGDIIVTHLAAKLQNPNADVEYNVGISWILAM